MEIGVVICPHVFKNERPIRYVCRADGEWQMLCGEYDDFLGKPTPRLVGLNHLLERDDTLREILDLPIDWQAEREDIGMPWKRSIIQSQ